eukprot:m.186068 g.186068  ORF g.186068 m.186068 type:complete len:100 (-) comp16918_c0_seq3:606-905(-)
MTSSHYHACLGLGLAGGRNPGGGGCAVGFVAGGGGGGACLGGPEGVDLGLAGGAVALLRNDSRDDDVFLVTGLTGSTRVMSSGSDGWVTLLLTSRMASS